MELERILQLVNQGGIARIILATRAAANPQELLSFASKSSGKIVPAVSTKQHGYVQNDARWLQDLQTQVDTPGYGAMAEVLMYHAQKGERAPLIVVRPDDERVKTALKYALDKKWPFVVHIEFAAAGARHDEFMAGLKALLVQYPEHPFVLMHMGQLDHVAVRQLITAHANIYFIASVSNPVSIGEMKQPWTNMFVGDRLSSEWLRLMVDYPDRFVLGFDNVFAERWGQVYLDAIALWRKAMKELPVEVAHAFAHGNAERLWRLAPVK